VDSREHLNLTVPLIFVETDNLLYLG